jgi:hypothetical protein
MVGPMVQGIDGVLRTLLAEPSTSSTHVRANAGSVGKSSRSNEQHATPHDDRQPTRPPTKARLGRPPVSSTETSARRKVTVRIRPELIDDYRNWSWDARSSLSHLVEQALIDYRDRRRK